MIVVIEADLELTKAGQPVSLRFSGSELKTICFINVQVPYY